jgi:hypothetical protein
MAAVLIGPTTKTSSSSSSSSSTTDITTMSVICSNIIFQAAGSSENSGYCLVHEKASHLTLSDRYINSRPGN